MLHDLEVLNDCLTQFGVDIFANHAYDTWVLFTVQARVLNNVWDVGPGKLSSFSPAAR